MDGLTAWELFALLLYEVAHLLGRVDVDQTAMRALDHVVVVGNAQAVLPVVGVGIGQLVVLARSLVRDVEHAREVGYHLIFLETYCHHLRVVRVQLGRHLEGCLTKDGRTLVRIYHEAGRVGDPGQGKDALIRNLGTQQFLDKSLVQLCSSKNLKFEEDPLEHSVVRPLSNLVAHLSNLSLEFSLLLLSLQLAVLESLEDLLGFG